MADTAGTGAPGEASMGLEFRDGPEDMARMARYEDYLKLQQRADGMSNAEYLAELDRIMEKGDGFDEGDTRYGAADAQAADADAARQDGIEREERLRANLEDGKTDARDMDGNAYLLDAEAEQDGGPNETRVPVQDGPADGTSLEQGPVPGSAPGADPDGMDGVDGQAGAPEEPGPALPAEEHAEGAAAGESWLGADPVIHDEPDPEPAAENDGPVRDVPEGSAHDMDGLVQTEGPASVQDGHGPPEDGAENGVPAGARTGGPQDGAEDGGPAVPGDGTDAPDDPEEQRPVAGPAPGTEDEDEKAAPEGPAGPETYHIPGHVEVHEEQFRTTDFLDEMSVATGLASSVQTAEYVPPRDVAVEPAKGSAQPVPERSEKMQELMAKAERDRAREIEKLLDGPSL